MSSHIDPCDADTNGGDCECAAEWASRYRQAAARVEILKARVADLEKENTKLREKLAWPYGDDMGK